MGTDVEWSYRDALRALWERSSYERGYVSNPFGDLASAERGMERTRDLVGRLGNPDQALAIVHVAGSKGKGSTASMVAAVADRAGHRVGLYTSPHLHSFRERIAIAGDPLPEREFAALAREVVAAADRMASERPALGRVTTFEVLTAMGLLGFARSGCALAVVEVGLGGTFDATNVVDPLVAVVTRIDLEHVAVLGDSLAAIAGQKGGIIKPRRPTVVAPQPAEAAAVFEAVAAERGSPLWLGGREWQTAGTWQRFRADGPWGSLADLRLGLPGAFQVENAGTAIATATVIDRAGFPIGNAAIRDGLARARWPGRFEVIRRLDRQPVVLDGAHTPAAAAALAAAFAAEFPGQRATAVLGVLSDKDPAAIAGALEPVLGGIVATRSAHPRALSTADVVRAVAPIGVPTRAVEPVADALASASRAGASVVLVTGSLSVVAEAREALGLGSPDRWPPDGAPEQGERRPGGGPRMG